MKYCWKSGTVYVQNELYLCVVTRSNSLLTCIHEPISDREQYDEILMGAWGDSFK